MLTQPSHPLAPNERIAVTLKSLIDLAKPAASLSLNHKKLRAAQSGAYTSRFKGRGMEFDEARLYQAGDDVRSIDWRVTARTGKPHTKVFREERERPVFISVDHREAMHFATRGVFKSVLAAQIAALLAWTAHHHGDRIGGQLFSELDCLELKPRNSKQAVLRFLNALAKPVNEGIEPFTLEHVLARLVHHAHPGSLVYLISDFRSFNDKAQNHLIKLSRHCDVVLVFIYDPLECALPNKGRFRFAHNEQEVVIDSSETQRLHNYQQRFLNRQDTLQTIVKKTGIALMPCSTVDNPLIFLQ